MSGLVDAHVHVWDPAVADYPWMLDTPELRRRFDLDHVGGELERLGVDGVVLVQAADNVDDTNNMLAAAERHRCVLGVVAWVPLTDPARAAAQLDAWSERPIVGIRHLIHRDPDQRLLLDPRVRTTLRLAAERGLVFDLCAETTELLALVPGLANALPEMTIVVDHLAKPPIRAQGWEPWATLLTAAAACDNVVAKLSGLNTAAPVDWTSADLQPYVDHAVDAFGPTRLMLGSDWPFALLNGSSYEQIAGGLIAALQALSEPERRAVCGDTAQEVYGLAAPSSGELQTRSSRVRHSIPRLDRPPWPASRGCGADVRN